MKKFKESILVVSLSTKTGKEVAHNLADKLGMLYASCKDIVDYEVFDSKAVIEKCGVDYFKKKEDGAIKHIAKYENCVIFVDYDYFVRGYNYFIKNCNFVFIKVKKKNLEQDETINSLAFEEREKELEEKSEFVVTAKSSVEKTTSEIIKQFRSEK